MARLDSIGIIYIHAVYKITLKDKNLNNLTKSNSNNSASSQFLISITCSQITVKYRNFLPAMEDGKPALLAILHSEQKLAIYRLNIE